MDNYQIYEEIGRGQYSVVYKGRRKKSIQYLAIKCVDKVNKEKVVNEVQLMNQLDHINVLKFFNWYETSNHYWIILEYCCGGDLMNLLMQDKKLPEKTVHIFGIDIVQGLEYIHSRGIVFCNIKPSNILLNGSGILKLSDFGLSQTIEEALNEDSKKKRRGTPYYMAPELFKGGKYTICSDLWSLGCVFYELATGSPPFVHKDFEQLVNDIIYKKHEPINNFSAEFNLLIEGLLEKDPNERITWDEVRNHVFWNGKFPKKKYLEHQKQFLKKPNIYENEMSKKMETNVSLSKIIKEKEDYLEEENETEDEDDSNRNRNGRTLTDIEYDFETPTLASNNNEDEIVSGDDEYNTGMVTPSPEDDVIDYSEEKKKKINLGKKNKNYNLNNGRRRIKSNSSKKQTKKQNLHKKKKKKILQKSLETHGIEGLKIENTGKDIFHLFFNYSDKSVKPIVLNHRIEKFNSPKFKSKSLPFKPLNPSQIMNLSHSDSEQFLTKIHRSLIHNSRPDDKLNILCYYESLARSSQVAEQLLNCSMTKLFVKMLSSYKSVTVRYRILSILGLLIRNSGFISSILQNYGIFLILETLLRSNQHMKIRRRAMAVTGELAFYISSRQVEMKKKKSKNKKKKLKLKKNEESSSSKETEKVTELEEVLEEDRDIENWVVPWSKLIPSILRCIMKNEDEILQHYTVKTLDNLSCYDDNVTSYFANNEETLNSLVHIYMTTKNNSLKSSALSSLSRICKFKPTLSILVVKKFGGARQYLTMGNAVLNSTNQTCNFLNILNLSLLKEPDNPIITQLLEDLKFVPTCLRWLKSNDQNVCGKVLMTIFFTCKVNRKCYYKFFENQDDKYCQTLEMLYNKKNDQFVQNSLFILIHETARIVSPVLEEIRKDLESMNSLTRSKQKNSFSTFNIIYYIFSVPCLASKAVNEKSLISISRILKYIKLNFQKGTYEYVQTVFNIVEHISQQHQLIIDNFKAIIDHILPNLIDLLNVNNGDVRFLCLKIFTDIICKFLKEPEIYNAFDKDNKITISINKLIINKLFKNYSKILKDQDPIPLYGLKLLNQICEKNPYFLTMLEDLKTSSLKNKEDNTNIVENNNIQKNNSIIPQLISFFELEHKNNNVHNVRLILKIISADLVDLETLYTKYRICERLNKILSYAFDNGIEAFFEPCLSIVDHLLFMSSKYIKECKKNSKLHNKAETIYSYSEELLKNLNIYIKLMDGVNDHSVIEISGHIMVYITQLYNGCHEFIMTKGFPIFVENLGYNIEDKDSSMLFLKILLILTSRYFDGKFNIMKKLVKKEEMELFEENLLKLQNKWEGNEKIIEITQKLLNNLFK